MNVVSRFLYKWNCFARLMQVKLFRAAYASEIVSRDLCK